MLTRASSRRQALSLPEEETLVSQASGTGRLVGDVLSVAAIVIALINNDSVQWAIGVPVVLAVVGVGLRIEAAIGRSSQAPSYAETVL